MELELVSFKTCPYVQRSVITLKRKGVPFEITYIDLEAPPAWFQEASPLGKVPILKVKGEEETILFESAVINEFVDEITPGRLMPEDALDRAKTRAWIQFGSECLMDYYQSCMAPDEAGYLLHKEALQNKLARLDVQVEGPFFLGTTFTLADAAIAPLLMRLQEYEKIAPGFTLAEYPRLAAWARALEVLPEVQESMVPEWRDLLAAYLRRGWVGQSA